MKQKSEANNHFIMWLTKTIWFLFSHYMTNPRPQTWQLNTTHTYYLFSWVKILGMTEMDLVLRVSQGCNQGIGQDTFSPGVSTEGEFTSKLTHNMGSTHFLAFVGPRVLIFSSDCWLEATLRFYRLSTVPRGQWQFLDTWASLTWLLH